MPAAGKGGARRTAKVTTKKAPTTKQVAARPASTRATPATKKRAAPAKASKGSKVSKVSKAAKVTKATKVTKASKPAKTATKALTRAPARTAVKTPVKTPVKTAAKTPAKTAPVATAPAPAKKGGKKTVICELSGFEVTPSAANLSPKTLERLKGRLLEERERLLRQADGLDAEAEQLARDRDGGDTQFDEESGEGDTINIERERDLLLSASAREHVDDIDAALVRMRKGTYGVCIYAGRKLPLERLEVFPWADVCVDCKARAERRR
jgi:RNA polymerase-binding transcription factor DksA